MASYVVMVPPAGQGNRPDLDAAFVRDGFAFLAFFLPVLWLLWHRLWVEAVAALVREAGVHVGTGFLATPDLLPVLADHGHLDLAYELLLQDTSPAWLAMIARGATTVWERWDGVDEDGVPHESLNHYSKGAVISFLHLYTAGIELLDDEPAYRRFRVRPRPGGGLTWAKSAHDSPYGRIESAWRLDGNAFELRVVVPAGTRAEVVLPDGTTATGDPGEHSYRCTVAHENLEAAR